MFSESSFFPSARMRNLSDCGYPCPGGWYRDPPKPCSCAPLAVTKHQKRISGPMLDRIDIHIEVPHVNYEKLSSDRLLGEPTFTIHQICANFA
jgi:magnesium chelatase family protein